MKKKYYCKSCGKEISYNSAKYGSGLCKSCSQKGERSHNWKGGKPRCIDCGAILANYNSKRCRKCSAKHVGKLKKNVHKFSLTCQCVACKAKRGELKGINNPNYSSGKRAIVKHVCPYCNKVFYAPANRKFCSRSCANKYRWSNKEYKTKFSVKAKKLWEREEFRKKYLKSISRKKSKPEKELEIILNNLFPNEYKFVGLGDFFIKRFNPDFININGKKKIIELYSDYWHNLPEYKKRDKKRLKTYKKYGYDTLIVWQKELEDIDNLKNKLIQFHYA